MAEPLRNHFGERIPRTIAARITAVWPEFPADAFVADALDGYEALGLMERGRHIARALRRHLPETYPAALEILLRSVGDRPVRSEGDGGMATFLYLPHVSFVAEFGLDDFERSMEALYHLTQRFTGEFAIRPFIDRYESESLALLRRWAKDPNPHVRRLVSEGTRPRLPWASRLGRFQADPAPVLELLEILRDDPDPNVRRSVANSLNDIAKDHPEVVIEVAGRWMADATEERRALVRHALRSLVKQGHAGALGLLGFDDAPDCAVEDIRIEPDAVTRAGRVTIAFVVRATGSRRQRLLVDLRVHYVKANGTTSPRVFKLKSVVLEPGGTASFRKSLSLADLTTRKHHEGRHRVEALINGRVVALGSFVVEG